MRERQEKKAPSQKRKANDREKNATTTNVTAQKTSLLNEK